MMVEIIYHETNFQGQQFERSQTLTVEPSGDPITAARLAFWQTFTTAEDIQGVHIQTINVMEAAA